MMSDWLLVAIFGAFFAGGVWATHDLRTIHLSETRPRNRITRAFYVVSLVITVVAGVIGFLDARRVLGFAPLPGTSIVVFVSTCAVLTIPLFLSWTIRQIRRGP